MFVPKKNRGDTLIEVLVTSIILAIGVLGSAGMQLMSLKNLQSSYSNSSAQVLASDLSERMRANSVATHAGQYIHQAAPINYSNCVNNACSSQQLANYDIATWWEQLNNALPMASGEVKRIGAGNTFNVIVRWDDDHSGSSGKNCPVKSPVDLDCYQFSITVL